MFHSQLYNGQDRAIESQSPLTCHQVSLRTVRTQSTGKKWACPSSEMRPHLLWTARQKIQHLAIHVFRSKLVEVVGVHGCSYPQFCLKTQNKLAWNPLRDGYTTCFDLGTTTFCLFFTPDMGSHQDPTWWPPFPALTSHASKDDHPSWPNSGWPNS